MRTHCKCLLIKNTRRKHVGDLKLMFTYLGFQGIEDAFCSVSLFAKTLAKAVLTSLHVKLDNGVEVWVITEWKAKVEDSATCTDSTQ